MDIRRFGMQEGVDALLDAYEGPSVYQRPPQNPETLALLEALLTKSPGGMLQTTMDTASDIGNVLGSIGQLDKAEALGRQVRRTLPNIVNAVSSDVGGTYDAMAAGLKQAVLDRGAGALFGLEDLAMPGLSMMSKLGAAGTALGMAATPMGKRTREQLLKEIADAGSQAQANKIARPAIEEYGYDPVLVDALREKREPSIFEKREGLSSGKENPAAIRREKMRGNPEFKQRLPQDVKGETIATPLDISQREIVQPESMVGNVAIGVPGDRSARTRIEQLGGVKLDEPIDVQGGPAYGFGRDDFSWASNYGIARGKQNHVITASEATGLPVLGIYTAMGEGAVDFSTPVVEMLMGQLNTIRVPVAARKKLDQKINEAIQTVNKQRIAEGVKKGRPIEVIEDSLLDEFLGIDHPEAMAQLLGTTGASGKEYRRFGSGDLRKVVVQTIAREDMRGLGFPSYKDAAYQMTEPELRSVQRGDTGGAILRMDPDATLRDPDAPPDAGHRSYDTGIPGQYQGVMEQVDIPAPVMFPKTFDRYRTLKTKEGNPMELHSQMGKFHMGADFEVLDQQWLDGVRSYMERKGITDLGGVPTLAFLLLGAGGLNAMASDDPEMQAAGGAMMGAAAMGGVPKVVREAAKGAMTARGARSAELAAEQAQTGAIAGMGRPVGQATEAELVQQIENNKQIFKDNFEKKKAGIITEEEWKSLLQPLREKDKYLRAQATAAKGREYGAGQAYDTLDDVEKARIDRAVEQGFNIDAFHGTKADIESFDPGLLGITTGAGSARVGFFFAADPNTAKQYARHAEIEQLNPERAEQLRQAANAESAVGRPVGQYDHLRYGENIIPVKLRLTNPLEYDFQGKGYREVTYRELLEKARMDGNDGAIFRNTRDGGETTDIYVVFDPAQIRSRFATFDPESAPKTVTPDDIDKQKRIVASLERAVQRTDAENVRLNMEWDELSNEAYSKPNISEQEGNRLAELSAEIQRNDEYVQYLIGEIGNVKAQANVRTEGTGDLLASVAPVLYPVGAGAAAAAYTVNNE